MEPKMLFLDIETAPDVVWTWGMYQANAISVKEHWYILSFAAKYRGGKAEVIGLNDFPGYTHGSQHEYALLSCLWTYLDEADIVIAHNGADFDVKKINAKFIEYDFNPPSPFKVIDTKRDLTRVSRFSSNRLDWLSKQFNFGKKISTDFSLWQGCMDGDSASWRKMKEYNKHDVVLLEKLYDKIAPWIDQPNMGLYNDGLVCVNPSCGSKNLIKRGFARAKTRMYQRYVCKECGTWSRGVNSIGATKITRAG